MFRGSGGNNYCAEILHFLLNLKHIWTPGVRSKSLYLTSGQADETVCRDIMRDNMLVNVSGLTGHAMPIDLNIEHLIGELKKLLQAKGLNSMWDRLGNISAAIDIIKRLKKRVSVAMKTTYQSTTHTDPKTDHLVWRVANKTDLGMRKPKPVPDILAMGEMKLLSSSLDTFNRKFCAMAEGKGYDEEFDSLPQMALAVDPDGNNDADELTVE
ncbi:hypothetical protein H4582DRAFT_1817065 [Lactarius indigo]|nr:hypothetical protein H4582DRAFT_1817065 [Lactarius indigo]